MTLTFHHKIQQRLQFLQDPMDLKADHQQEYQQKPLGQDQDIPNVIISNIKLKIK